MMSYSNIYDVISICRTHARTEPVRTPKFSSDNASDNCDKIVACRVASNYPFAKLMEIAESVPTGRVRQATKF